jgi:hypothetical protein
MTLELEAAFLQAGIGFGGGCLPKDIRAFMARSEELGAQQALEFLREIDSINMRARQRMIDLVRKDLAEALSGKGLQCWEQHLSPIAMMSVIPLRWISPCRSTPLVPMLLFTIPKRPSQHRSVFQHSPLLKILKNV